LGTCCFFFSSWFYSSSSSHGVGNDSLCWGLNGNGKFDTHSFYNELRATPNSIFPWKSIWKAKIPKNVAFFPWTAAHNRILTLDNLMLRGRPLANWFCMCRCNGESMDHLLIHCHVANYLLGFYASGFRYSVGLA